VVSKFLRFCNLYSRDVTAQYKRVSPGAGPTQVANYITFDLHFEASKVI
jgi:hypothetical protein